MSPPVGSCEVKDGEAGIVGENETESKASVVDSGSKSIASGNPSLIRETYEAIECVVKRRRQFWEGGIGSQDVVMGR